MKEVTESRLNLFKLKSLFNSGMASIPIDKKHNSAVLVIGDTGVGKTTILSFLARRKLYIKIHGLNTILDSDDQDGLKIGHDKFSQTRVPCKIIIDHLVFFDCSGFKDNRGEEFQISNSFFVQRLFDIYANIKILLIVDQTSISQARADKLPKLIRNLLKAFNSLSDIQNGIILLINKAKPQFTQKTYLEQLLKMSKLKGDKGFIFNTEEQNFISFLVMNKRVCLFKQAQKEDQGKILNIKEQNLLHLIRDTNFVKSKKINHIISQSAKLSIREFVDHLADQAESKIQNFCQELSKDLSYRSHASFSNPLNAAKQIKTKITAFAKLIETSNDTQLIDIIRDNINVSINSFQQDARTVLFFKQIYNKLDYYFKLVRSNISSTLSKMLLDIEQDITTLEKQQKDIRELKEKAEEAVKKQQLLQQQLEQYKNQHQQYTSQMTETNKKHTDKINQLEQSVIGKNSEIVQLNKKMDKINIEFDQLKNQKEEQCKKNNEITNQLNSKLDEKKKQVEELTKFISQLRLDNQSLAEQIGVVNAENDNLKKVMSTQSNKFPSIGESIISKDSKTSKKSTTSKYPDINCPHFLNGGQCINCIRAWKKEQNSNEL